LSSALQVCLWSKGYYDYTIIEGKDNILGAILGFWDLFKICAKHVQTDSF
jgi:hypothetical protein